MNMKRIFLLLLTSFYFLVLAAQTPVAYYPFTGNANDAVGSLNGTVNGATLTTDRFGNANSAYSFDGVNDDIIMSTVATTQTDNFTISVWVKPSTLNQFAYILNNGDGGNGYGILQANGAGSSGNTVTAIYHNVTYLNSGQVMATANVWYHIVLVRSSGISRFYVNGVTTGFTNAATPNTPVGRLTIGVITGILRFNGSIDEVKIYNTALNGAQVLQEFNTSQLPIPSTNLQHWFKADAGISKDANNLVTQWQDQSLNQGKAIQNSSSSQPLWVDNILNTKPVVRFDGSNDIFQVFQNNGTTPVTSPAGLEFTFFIAIKATTPVSAIRYQGSGSCLAYPYNFQGVANGFIACSDGGPSAGIPHGLSASEFNIGTARYKANTTNGMQTFANGLLVGQRNSANISSIGSDPLGFGGCLSGCGVPEFFGGDIAEIIIYDRAVTNAERLEVEAYLADKYSVENQVAQQKPGSGTAISFDGADDHITTGAYLVPTVGNFTTEMWVFNRSNTAGPREFISQGSSGSAFYMGTANLTGIIRLGDTWQNTGVVMPLNKWVHLAVVKSGTNGTLYLNGIQVATQTNYMISVAGTQTLIGRQYGGLDEFPDANLDEVRIWNIGLTQTQIRERMCRKISNGDVLINNLVGYYNFDESTGNTAFDGTSNVNNGTLTNGPTRVTSGAAIGNTSTHNYVTTGLPTANLSFNGQDNLAVTYTAGTFTSEAGTHIYSVNEKPNTENGITAGSNNRYFGVYNANLTTPAYTATYNYTGNPSITNENGLGLYKRTDNAGAVWSATVSTLNTTANTLVTTGQNTEYMLGEAALNTYYRDADGDTYGNLAVTIQAVAAPVGYVANSTDCNDASSAVNPGAAEVCDGIDNNCDGQIDNLGQTIVLRSGNGSIGQTDATVKMLVGPDDVAFSQPFTVADFTASRNGTAPTIIQNHPAWMASLAADPLAKWINNTGNNGNGNTCLFAINFTINGPVSSAEINFNYAIDNFLGGAPNEGVYLNGQALSGSTSGGSFGTNFNITKNDIAPLLVQGLNTLYVNASELGGPGGVIFAATITTQSSCVGQTWYADADGDTFGNPLVSQTSFSQPPGYVLNNTDCNDAAAASNPAATEVCDGIDNNCDGIIDEGVKTTWFKDSDSDGYSDGTSQQACSRPALFKTAAELTATSGDCNDAIAAINPGATEVCDGIDNNCDGIIDEGVKTTWFKDSDSDGYSDGTSQQACSRPALFKTAAELTATSGDCNDAIAAINPGATEICDGIDNNCNGQVDEGLTVTWYLDLDNDGYGTGANLTQCSRPIGYKLTSELTSTTGDCNDNAANINPGAQTLSFSGNQGFTTSFADPQSGSPYTLFNFEVKYTDAANQMPPNGYPRVLLDFEGNGIFNNPNDRLLVLNPTDVGDNNTSNGKIYRGSINQLAPGNNWQSRIIVVNGACSTATTINNYPIVKVLPDIEIYANDIQFSTPNPAVSSPLTVSATIHNVSDFNAQNFVVKIINQFDPSINYGNITVDNIDARSSRQISWNIITPSIPAWCPIQVVIDQTNVIDETNELNNTAIRPFTNGNYDVPGVIVVNATVSPSVSYPSPGSTVTLSGNAFYDEIAVPLADPSVAGAEVTFTVTETGETFKGVTNSSGNFSISFIKPQAPGEYHITGSVTDFTITDNFATSFLIICLPDLTPTITLSANQIIEGQSLTAQFKVSNIGCLPAPATQLFVSQTGGTPAIPNINVPALAPGETYASATIPLLFATRGDYSITAVADGGQIVSEQNEGNNTAVVYIKVLPPLPDLLPSYGPQAGPFELCKSPTLASFVLHNSGGVSSGPFTTTVRVVLNGNVLETFSHPVANIGALGFYSFSVPYTYANAGEYHFEVSVDVPFPDGVVTELREDNNYADYLVTIVPCLPPNLILVAENCQRFTTLNPIDPVFPGTMVLTSRVNNAGSLPAAGPIKVRFDISNGASYIGTYNGGLAPGETVSISVTVPTVPPATETLVTTVDPLNEVAESNEDDNVGPVENLCVNFSPLVACGNAFSNNNYTVNQGIQPSIEVATSGLYYVSSVKVKFEVSGPGITGTLNLGDATILNPRPNCVECYKRAILPSTFVFTENGVYTFTMTVDPNNEYTECNEADNVIVQTVRVSNKPDMRILSQYINPSLLNPDINEPVNLLVTYENIGTNNVDDRMKLKVLVDEVELSTVSNVTGLVNGDKATISIPVPWSSSIVGAHIIRAIIDADNSVSETTENNNDATRAIIVGPAANFRFLVFEPSKAFPAVGEAITINATIENNGLESANSEVVFMYINNNGDTVEIGTIPISLVAGGSKDIQLPWFVAQVPARLVGRIQNSTVLETTLEDNVATNEIGKFSVIVLATTACDNQANGSLSSKVSGGKAPFTYLWSNSATTQQITAAPGIYQVAVTDAEGRMVTGEAVIENRIALTYYADADGDGFGNNANTIKSCTGVPVGYVNNNTDCDDSKATNYPGATEICGNNIDDNCNGMVDENCGVCQLPTPTITSNKTSPICANESVILTSSAATGNSWSNGETTQSITVNTSGTFTVKTTNAAGCTSANSAATTVTINPIPTTPTISAGGLLRFCTDGSVVLTSGAATGNTWSNGATTQSITVNTSGSFTVKTTNANGCTSANSAATAVTVDPLPSTPTASVTVQPTCTVATGTIVVTAPTGAGITYSIGGVYQASGTFNNVAAGTYNVTAQNASGCISSATSVTVNTPPGAPAIPTVSVTAQPTCTVATGKIVVTAPTGAGITYSIGGVYQASGAFNNVAAGTYNVTAQNSSGCISSLITITVNQQPVTPAAPTASVTVQPTCKVATGKIVVTAPTGAGITYSIGGVYQASGTFNNVAAGTYNITAQNASGCISSATSVTVNTPPGAPVAPTASVTVQPTCTVATGTIVVTAPTGAGITYSIGGVYQASGAFNNVSAGTYNVTAQNASGCISSATSVTVNTPPGAPVAPTASVTVQPTCTVATGTIVVTAPSGAGITYSIGGDYQASKTFNGVAAGTYNVTAKNTSGCISSAKSLTVNTPTGAPVAPTASVTCQPTCTTHTGTIVVTAPSGAGITYSIGGAYQASGTFSGLAAGTYNMTAKNASGCISAQTSVSVNAALSAPAKPIITAGGPTTFCNGGSVVLTSSKAASYLWSNGAITQSTTITTGGTYSVVVKNSSNCTAASAGTIVTVNNCNGVYCAASGTVKNKGFIQKVRTCRGINNNSGWNNGYGNFLNLKATYRLNTCFGLAITPGYVNGICNNPKLFTKVWIDWNQDGDFTDAGELVFASANASNLTRKAWIKIPATARTGHTRMRVVMSCDARVTSCGTFTFGEVEDYTLCITALAVGRNIEASPADYIDEEEPGTLFSVYPNPVANRLTIERSGYNEEKAGNSIVLMQLVDGNGKIVLQSRLINLVQAFDVSKFASGMYFIQIKTNSTVTSKKIFIQH